MPPVARKNGQEEWQSHMPLSLRLNRVLLCVFTTLWTLAYYVAYFRNPVYLVLVAIAVALDLVRLSPDVSSRVYTRIVSARITMLAAIAALFVAHCWVVVSGILPQVAFGGPYDHFSIAILAVSTPYAAAIYGMESAGALASYLIIAYYGIQSSAANATSVIEETDQALAQTNSRRELRKLLGFIVLLYALQMSAAIVSIHNGIPRVYEYHPQSNPIQLALFSATPVFFAFGMKVWLREVRAFLKRVNSIISGGGP